MATFFDGVRYAALGKSNTPSLLHEGYCWVPSTRVSDEQLLQSRIEGRSSVLLLRNRDHSTREDHANITDCTTRAEFENSNFAADHAHDAVTGRGRPPPRSPTHRAEVTRRNDHDDVTWPFLALCKSADPGLDSITQTKFTIDIPHFVSFSLSIRALACLVRR